MALLRGINVGGRRPVAGTDLVDLLAHLGLSEARSILQSGNLVFRSGSRANARLERLLESGARSRLGLETDFFVRSAEEWDAIVAGNPFPRQAESDPGRLVLVLLEEAPVAGRVAALQAAIAGPEVVRPGERHAYVSYPDGQGRSRLTNALVERVLGSRATSRNWNTVRKIHEVASAR